MSGQTHGLNRRAFLAAAGTAVAGAAAIPLVGCGGNQKSPAAATARPASPPAATTAWATPGGAAKSTQAPAQQPKQGGTWHRGAGGNIALASLPYIDAGSISNGGNGAARDPGLIWGNLIAFAEDKLGYLPDHAKEWQLATDGMSIKFVIRDDIYFHSGRKFTTKDIAFNLEEVKKDKWKTSQAARLNPVASYQVIDDYTMNWTFARPNPPVFDFMATFRLADMDTIDKIQSGTLIGTGAFKWTTFDPVSGATLDAYDKYHLGRPLLDKIEYKIYADAAALAIALETGEVDDSALSPEESVRFYNNQKFATVKLPSSGGSQPIGIRTDLDPLKDKRIRQAIEFMLDRERYQKENFLGRFDELGRLPWPTFSPAYDKDLDKPIYDLARAKSLVREAGFPNGMPTPIKLDTLPIRPYSPAIAQLLQQDGAQVGLKFEFAPLEYANMLDRYYKGMLDNMWIGFGDSGSPLSPSTSLLFATLTDGAVTHYDDPEYLAARKAIVEGGQDYARFNRAYLDGAFALVLSRPIGINFESPRIHISRNFLGWTEYHKTWVS